ncbi:hypothetical protein F0562_022587 [Nyssa sinensis]|uniref:Uncharacterized protein n=1 Tax=Nyssa sinensis TaxID=561372 RepID=A0A5J5BPJ6_9ASTE|nr:hypothetical protein F0562_022587 [Nyssa sinensis]
MDITSAFLPSIHIPLFFHLCQKSHLLWRSRRFTQILGLSLEVKLQGGEDGLCLWTWKEPSICSRAGQYTGTGHSCNEQKQ